LAAQRRPDAIASSEATGKAFAGGDGKRGASLWATAEEADAGVKIVCQRKS